MRKMFLPEELKGFSKEELIELGILDKNGRPVFLYSHAIFISGSKTEATQKWDRLFCSFGLYMSYTKGVFISFNSLIHYLKSISCYILTCSGSISILTKGVFLVNGIRLEKRGLTLIGQFLNPAYNENEIFISEDDFIGFKVEDKINCKRVWNI